MASSYEERQVKRGTIKSFREYLNTKCAEQTNWKHGAYQQRTRGYGDYLYHQDRAMFDNELHLALSGHESFKDWEFYPK